MSSRSFGKSVNPCGRRIAYPKFSALSAEAPPVTIAPAPGTDVEESVCQAYYNDKNISSASEECKSCWQNALDSDAGCPCNLDPANPCAFARCVHKEFNKPVAKCANAFAAVFNLDDVNDEKFQPPFDLSQLQNCPAGSNESFDGVTSMLMSPWVIGAIVVIFLVPVLYMLWKKKKSGCGCSG